MINIATFTMAILAIVSAVGLFMLPGRLFLPEVSAQEADTEITTPRTITVVGEGKVRIKPNVSACNHRR